MKTKAAKNKLRKPYFFIKRMLLRRRIPLSSFADQKFGEYVAETNERMCMFNGGYVYVSELKKMGPGFVGKVNSCTGCTRLTCRARNRFLIIIPSKLSLEQVAKSMIAVRIVKISDKEFCGQIELKQEPTPTIRPLGRTVTGGLNINWFTDNTTVNFGGTR